MQLNKVTASSFSFFNFSKKKTPKFKPLLLKFINAFLIAQFLLLNLQFINIYKYTDNVRKESVEAFENYNNLQMALRKGDQENIIYEFINLKSKHLSITDLLASTVIRTKNIEIKSNEDSYKIDKNTHKTLDVIFEKMNDAGYQKEKNNLNEFFSCLTMDFSCMTISYLVKNSIQPRLGYIRLKSQIATYDSQHPEEYQRFIDKIQKDPTQKEYIKSPGELYFESKNK